ncbi:hypothetical protein Dtox_3652 [Desulfofarcimen acetoxidans DSM 771]|uniref:Transposase Tn5-like N-terminal domain-containing protein n=1 Tax=Desulfofarcimen acetoxidans (strain ATCC 49208 / DSM 771 / KCTC 5769 / VKM B-1644 / 5575) TaxID=485916 RepID=C8VWJ8_DESAS|nr:transposase DNA-binding-containing protein [Desulfofarcimen acetoxidans]ACV64362.1 hypothetical protein Dtox_3652 [Desulfofarcimen acetoxidans DSM 771]
MVSVWSIRYTIEGCAGRLGNFGDTNLTHRLVSLVASLTEHPEKSLPEALGQWSDVKAAYR